MKLSPQLRQHWLRYVILGVAILGVPLSYLTGYTLAVRENASLDFARFRLEPHEVEPFERIIISGAGVDVEVVCAAEFRIDVAEHPDEIYFFQRTPQRLRIAAQQLTSTQPFAVTIYMPSAISFIDLRNGADLKIPGCAVNSSQLTANFAAGATLEINSGLVADLFLFGSTGAQLIAGPRGPIIVDEAVVDMVFGASANLCGVLGKITGSSAVKAKIRVRPDAIVNYLHPGVIERTCPESLATDATTTDFET